jgi:hypothetical protein
MARRSEDGRQPVLQPIRVAYRTGHRETRRKLANGGEHMEAEIGSGLALLRVKPDPGRRHAGPHRAEYDLRGVRVQQAPLRFTLQTASSQLSARRVPVTSSRRSAGRNPASLPAQEVALKQCRRVLVTQHELHRTQSGGMQRRVDRLLGPLHVHSGEAHELGEAGAVDVVRRCGMMYSIPAERSLASSLASGSIPTHPLFR